MNNNLKGYFKTLSMLHLALVIGIVTFGAIVFTLTQLVVIDINDLELIPFFNYAVTGITIISVFASFLVFKKKLIEINNINDLETKMNNYRSALILKYALYEGPALFSIVAIILTGKLYFFAFTIMMVLLMIVNRPQLQKAVTDLFLNEQDIALLENAG